MPWRAVSAGLAALLVLIAACFDLEWTARAWDAQEELQWARRIVSLGGPLYATTADQKGPLWQLCYVLAYAIGGSLNAWFVVAGMIIAVALTTSLAVWVIALRAGPSRVVAGGAASAVVLILVLGPEEFSHELYSRNLTGLLLVAALAAIVTLPHVRGRRRTLLMVGAAMAVGLQVQTIPGSVFSALLCGALVLWMGLRGPLADEARLLGMPRRFWAFAGIASATLATAFVWYGIRGSLPDFWAEWFTYNRYYSEATGRSYVEQVEKAAQDLSFYYHFNPFKTILLIAFVSDLARRLWMRASVWLDVTLVAWWLAACLEVAAAQRFFPHYLILPFLPVATMGCVLAARWGEMVPAKLRAAAAMSPVLLALVTSGYPRLLNGLDLALRFRGPTQTLNDHIAALPPDRQRLRKIVSFSTRPDDYIYAYTNYIWVYTEVDRPAASRYIAKRWLEGEIFWVGKSPNWVLPRTWDNWRADMLRTPPRLFITFSDAPVPPDSPAAQLLSCAYRVLHREPKQTVHMMVRPVDQCL